MNEPISGASRQADHRRWQGDHVLQAQARAVWLRAMVLRRRWLSRVTPDRGVARATNEPVSGALVKLTNESRKVILALAGARSRAGEAGAAAGADRAQEIVLARRACLPRNLRRHSRGRPGRHRARLWTARPRPDLAAKPRSLHRGGDQRRAFRSSRKDRRRHPAARARRTGRPVPPAQHQAGRQGRLDPGAGAVRRHRHERQRASVGAHRAGQRRLHRSAASACSTIDAQGLSLSFSRPTVAESEAPIRGSLPADGDADQAAPPVPAETAIAKRRVESVPGGQVLDVTRTVAEVFERARSGNTSYLTRFGVKDALVVLSQNGAETSWQVPDFSIDLEHKNGQTEHSRRPSQYRLDQRRLAARLPHGAANPQAKPRHHGADPESGPLGACRQLLLARRAQGSRHGGERRNHRRAVQLRRVLVGRGQARLGVRPDHAALGPRQPAAHRQGRAQRALSERERTWSRSRRRRSLGAEQRDLQRRVPSRCATPTACRRHGTSP